MQRGRRLRDAMRELFSCNASSIALVALAVYLLVAAGWEGSSDDRPRSCPRCPDALRSRGHAGVAAAPSCTAAAAAAAAAFAATAASPAPQSGQLAGFDFVSWAAALRARAAAQHPAQAAAEAAIAAHMPTSARYALAARFPLPEIGAVVDLTDGTCLLGNCDKMARGASTWGPDTHIRDLINSIMLPCALRWTADDCLALDFGSNFGLHTFAMLQLGARVLSVEPQTDLCVASRASVAANGWAARSVILCGGVAATGEEPPGVLGIGDGLHRYEGPRSVPNYEQPRSVPLHTVGSLVAGLPAGAFLRLVKIDTDSIDCAVLAHVLTFMESGAINVNALILESWDGTCRGDNTIGRLLLILRGKGYTIVMVEQNFVFAAPLADRFLVMEHGSVIQEFTQAELPSRLERLHEYLGV